MNENNIQNCLKELAEVVSQLQNADPKSNSATIEIIMRLLKCIAFLEMENCCDAEVEAVNENITLYYMHRAEINRIIQSISMLAESMNESIVHEA